MDEFGLQDGEQELQDAEPAVREAAADVRRWLPGRRAAVVGAVAHSAGRAIVTRLAEEGAAIALLDRDVDSASVVAKELNAGGGRAAAFALDLRDEAQIAAIVGETEAWLDGLDLVVQIAAAPRGPGNGPAQLSAGPWSAALGTGLHGSVLLARHAVPALQRSGNGAMLLIGPADSGGSLPDGVRIAGMHGLAISLDRQLRPTGVRVLEVTVPPAALDPERAEPDGRGAAEIAATVAFAASDEGARIVGTIRTW